MLGVSDYLPKPNDVVEAGRRYWQLLKRCSDNPTTSTEIKRVNWELVLQDIFPNFRSSKYNSCAKLNLFFDIFEEAIVRSISVPIALSFSIWMPKNARHDVVWSGLPDEMWESLRAAGDKLNSRESLNTLRNFPRISARFTRQSEFTSWLDAAEFFLGFTQIITDEHTPNALELWKIYLKTAQEKGKKIPLNGAFVRVIIESLNLLADYRYETGSGEERMNADQFIRTGIQEIKRKLDRSGGHQSTPSERPFLDDLRLFIECIRALQALGWMRWEKKASIWEGSHWKLVCKSEVAFSLVSQIVQFQLLDHRIFRVLDTTKPWRLNILLSQVIEVLEAKGINTHEGLDHVVTMIESGCKILKSSKFWVKLTPYLKHPTVKLDHRFRGACEFWSSLAVGTQDNQTAFPSDLVDHIEQLLPPGSDFYQLTELTRVLTKMTEDVLSGFRDIKAEKPSVINYLTFCLRILRTVRDHLKLEDPRPNQQLFQVREFLIALSRLVEWIGCNVGLDHNEFSKILSLVELYLRQRSSEIGDKSSGQISISDFIYYALADLEKSYLKCFEDDFEPITQTERFAMFLATLEARASDYHRFVHETLPKHTQIFKSVKGDSKNRLYKEASFKIRVKLGPAEIRLKSGINSEDLEELYQFFNGPRKFPTQRAVDYLSAELEESVDCLEGVTEYFEDINRYIRATLRLLDKQRDTDSKAGDKFNTDVDQDQEVKLDKTSSEFTTESEPAPVKATLRIPQDKLTSILVRICNLDETPPQIKKEDKHVRDQDALSRIQSFLTRCSAQLRHADEILSQCDLPVPLKKAVLSEIRDWSHRVKSLLDKFGESSGNQDATFTLTSRINLIDTFYGTLGECCITRVYGHDIHNPNFVPIRIQDSEGRIAGYVFGVKAKIFGLNALVLAGIEPNTLLKRGMVSQTDFAQAIIQGLVQFARENGFEAVYCNAGSEQGSDDGRISELIGVREFLKNSYPEILPLAPDEYLKFPERYERPISYVRLIYQIGEP